MVNPWTLKGALQFRPMTTAAQWRPRPHWAGGPSESHSPDGGSLSADHNNPGEKYPFETGSLRHVSTAASLQKYDSFPGNLSWPFAPG